MCRCLPRTPRASGRELEHLDQDRPAETRGERDREQEHPGDDQRRLAFSARLEREQQTGGDERDGLGNGGRGRPAEAQPASVEVVREALVQAERLVEGDEHQRGREQQPRAAPAVPREEGRANRRKQNRESGCPAEGRALGARLQPAHVGDAAGDERQRSKRSPGEPGVPSREHAGRTRARARAC